MTSLSSRALTLRWRGVRRARASPAPRSRWVSDKRRLPTQSARALVNNAGRMCRCGEIASRAKSVRRRKSATRRPLVTGNYSFQAISRPTGRIFTGQRAIRSDVRTARACVCMVAEKDHSCTRLKSREVRIGCEERKLGCEERSYRCEERS